MAKKVLRYTEEQFIKLLENIVKKVKLEQTLNENYSVKKDVLAKLLKQGGIKTGNANDLTGLLLKVQTNSGGQGIAISDLPELKGKKWLYNYVDGVYHLKEIK